VNRKTITVETKPQREGQKSRSFSVELLAYLLANDLWELGAGSKDRHYRPVFIAYAGTDQASRAFSANLRAGRPAVVTGNSHLATKFEVPKSAGFRFETYSREGATLTLAYLPAVFSFQQPAADSGNISFLCLPPTWWVDEQAQATEEAVGKDAREAAVAAYFVALLDQRSPLPIANDLEFHLRIYRAALVDLRRSPTRDSPAKPIDSKPSDDVSGTSVPSVRVTAERQNFWLRTVTHRRVTAGPP